MRVVLVRSDSANCAPNCPEWISAQGRIDANSPGRLRKVLAQTGDRKLPILIDSAGGSVDPSLVMARLIRAKGLDVVVTKTVLTPLPACAPSDTACRDDKAKGLMLGKPEARISKCASACVHVLAGGIRRYVGPWTFVGVHQILATQTYSRVRQIYRVQTRYQWGVPVATEKQLISSEKVGEKVVSGPAKSEVYERIGKFLLDMGVSDSLIALMRATPHESVHLLKLHELRDSKIATDFITGEVLLGFAAPPRAPGTTAAPAPAQPMCMSLAGTMGPCPKLPPAAAPPAGAQAGRPELMGPAILTAPGAMPAALAPSPSTGAGVTVTAPVSPSPTSADPKPADSTAVAPAPSPAAPPVVSKAAAKSDAEPSSTAPQQAAKPKRQPTRAANAQKRPTATSNGAPAAPVSNLFESMAR
jgi:hypothetical protein